MADTEMSATMRKRLAEEFIKSGFWTKILKPWIDVQTKGLEMDFVNIKTLEHLTKNQGAHFTLCEVHDFIIGYPDKCQDEIDYENLAAKVEEAREP